MPLDAINCINNINKFVPYFKGWKRGLKISMFLFLILKKYGPNKFLKNKKVCKKKFRDLVLVKNT